MIDYKKLAETAEYHIKRGDSMAMDPAVVKELALLASPHREPDYWLGFGLQAHTEKLFPEATPVWTQAPPKREIVEQAVRSAILACKSATGQYEQIDRYVNGTHITNSVVAQVLSTEPAHDEDEFPECPHCGGTGLEVVSTSEAAQAEKPIARVYMGKREVSCHGPNRKYVDGLMVQLLIENIEPETLLYKRANPAPSFLALLEQAEHQLRSVGCDITADQIRAALAKHGVPS